MNNELNQAFVLVSKPDNVSIKRGEMLLATINRHPEYPLQLLNYMKNCSQYEGKLRAAIELKIWCQHYKDIQQFQRQCYLSIMQNIKGSIVLAYLTYQLQISKTLRPAIVALTDVQFPDNWINLVPGLLQYCNEHNESTISILKLLQSITHKYSYKSRSDPLYHEIIIVCETCHDFLLSLTIKIIKNLYQNSNQDTLKVLELLMKLFYNLNYQDLHPKFEDNLSNWMQILNQVMKINNTSQAVFKCKGATLQSILLYASKYKEDVQESIRGFSHEIWQLCSNATQDTEYDNIVLNCLKYFKSLILWQDMKEFFSNNMESLISKLVLPNLIFNKHTKTLFEEEVEVFIDYYFRNTEIGTRRSAALELLRNICRHYKNFQPFLESQIMAFLNGGQFEDPNSQCVLLNLLIDGAAKGFREIDGCTSLFIKAETILYCYENILKISLGKVYQWLMENKDKPVQSSFNLLHITTLLRFAFYFRVYLPTEDLTLLIKFAAAIQTKSSSLSNIVFIVINGLLGVRYGDFTLYRNLNYHFKGRTTLSIAEEVFRAIYLNTQTSSLLNQNLTRMLYLIIRALEELNKDFIQYQTAIFKQMLAKTSVYDFKSVSLLFQAIGLSIFWLVKTNQMQFLKQIQNQIHQYFQIALKRQSDLLNFCFQIFSLLLYFPISDLTRYTAIYISILDDGNWTDQNNSLMSSYLQYIAAYILKNKSKLIQDKSAIEHILSKLIQLERYQLFYRFLRHIIKIISLQEFYNSGYLKIAIQGTEVISKISIQAQKSALIFLMRLSYNFNTEMVINYINGLIPNFFENFLLFSKDIIKTMQMKLDKKLMFGTLCNAIAGCCFNAEVQGTMLNLLIDNTTCRFNFAQLDETIKDMQIKEKKQSAYQKLTVFKEVEIADPEIDIEEQLMLVQTYLICVQRQAPGLTMITDKNIEKMKRLNDKYIKT